jgi:hypothetical protein
MLGRANTVKPLSVKVMTIIWARRLCAAQCGQHASLPALKCPGGHGDELILLDKQLILRS